MLQQDELLAFTDFCFRMYKMGLVFVINENRPYLSLTQILKKVKFAQENEQRHWKAGKISNEIDDSWI